MIDKSRVTYEYETPPGIALQYSRLFAACWFAHACYTTMKDFPNNKRCERAKRAQRESTRAWKGASGSGSKKPTRKSYASEQSECEEVLACAPACASGAVGKSGPASSPTTTCSCASGSGGRARQQPTPITDANVPPSRAGRQADDHLLLRERSGRSSALATDADYRRERPSLSCASGAGGRARQQLFPLRRRPLLLPSGADGKSE
jgi:hypothetical protein